MKSVFSYLIFPLALLSCIYSSMADTPLGWINGGNTSAYTTTKGDFEINIAGLAVNDTIDFLNYRDDLIAASGRLEGDSGNLSGLKIELNYGVTRDLSVFYRRQEHALTLDLGEISSVNLLDIDESLDTTAQTAGLKWTFYRANLLNADNRNTAASLEVSAFSNKSDDFDVVIDEIRIDNLEIYFRDPQTFSIADLDDNGWKARVIYSWALDQNATGSFWAGYGESNASSGTKSDLTVQSLAKVFKQDFSRDESYYFLGASLNYQLTPRLPLLLSYEYINVTDSKLEQFPETPNTQLPSFFTGSSQGSETGNHTAFARLSYWLTSGLHISLSGNLYSNQFTGVLPHYSNPLSGSFSSAPYGFIGAGIGYRF